MKNQVGVHFVESDGACSTTVTARSGGEAPIEMPAHPTPGSSYDRLSFRMPA